MKKLLIAALLAVSAGTAVVPLTAGAAIIVVREAPPQPRHEAVPPARRGYVWTPGYWNWTGHRYTWHRGEYVRARAGYHWSEPTWQQRDGRWEFAHGEWRRGDRDGDGIPNRVDRTPDGRVVHDRGHDRDHDRGHGGGRDSDRDGVPNRADRDRDGDGVPNRHDARPDNPQRR